MPRLLVLAWVLFAPSLLGATPGWWRDRVFYEIFTRSFQDSNGDGIGDLRGIARRLDYLQSLGVGGIWLTPVFPSPSYHGYDATDYEDINPDYGTLDDMQALLDAAHARGIAVVLDFAVNHTSNLHPWFRNPELHDWYVRRAQAPEWGKWFTDGNEFYFSVFGSAMPQLNWRAREVRTAVRKAAEHWFRRGIDGLRLDAARYYAIGEHGEADTAQTHRAIAEMARALKSEFPDRLIIGEIWADSPIIASYGNDGEQLDLAFSFPIAEGLVQSTKQRNASGFVRALRENLRDIVDSGFDAPFLTNHDQTRVASELGGDRSALAFAAQVLLTLPGTPFLYYGEELGLPNGPRADDLDKRQPMPWTKQAGHGFTPPAVTPWNPFYAQSDLPSVEEEEAEPTSLLQVYRREIARRNADVVWRRGALLPPTVYADGKVATWRRVYDDKCSLVTADFAKLSLRIQGCQSQQIRR